MEIKTDYACQNDFQLFDDKIKVNLLDFACPQVKRQHFFFQVVQRLQASPLSFREWSAPLVNCSTIMDNFLNPGNSSYYPGFPLNISIVVYREGVSYLPIVMHHLGALS